ncbi:MAG: 30S ribosomal protein THX [Lentimicrobiaceae bacterium]|nr:30S ribosomal protein THX [Lentimicrobiaceae bacterium]
MGKGDKKTKRGKIIMGSHGVSRPRKKKASPVGQNRDDSKNTVSSKATVKKPTEVSPKETQAKTTARPKAAVKPKAAPADTKAKEKSAATKTEDKE